MPFDSRSWDVMLNKSEFSATKMGNKQLETNKFVDRGGTRRKPADTPPQDTLKCITEASFCNHLDNLFLSNI